MAVPQIYNFCAALALRPIVMALLLSALITKRNDDVTIFVSIQVIRCLTSRAFESVDFKMFARDLDQICIPIVGSSLTH